MKGKFLRVMLVLVFLALVANVVVTASTGESLIKTGMVVKLAFAALVVANLSIVGAALYFTTRAHQKHERTSLQWARRSFVVNGGVFLVLAASPWLFFPGSVSIGAAMRDAGFVILLLGLSNAVFAYSFYREYLRTVGTRPPADSHRRRRKAPRRLTQEEHREVTWEE